MSLVFWKWKLQEASLGKESILEDVLFKPKPKQCYALVQRRVKRVLAIVETCTKARLSGYSGFNLGIISLWSLPWLPVSVRYPSFVLSQASSVPFLSMSQNMLYLPIFLTFFPTGLWKKFGVWLVLHNIPVPIQYLTYNRNFIKFVN